MLNAVWNTVGSGAVGLASACIGASYTLWLQSRKDRIKQRDEETLYVECRAIKKNKQGFYIPGRGQLQIDRNELIQAKKRRMAFLCCEITPIDADIPIYCVERTVPI